MSPEYADVVELSLWRLSTPSLRTENPEIWDTVYHQILEPLKEEYSALTSEF